MTFYPRDYQCDADQALWNYIHTKVGKNPLVVLPTGTGKSLCIGMFIWRLMATYPSSRCMMLTHVKELIEGNYRTMIRLWPSAPAGVYSAGLGLRDVHAPVTFAGIQSVAKRPGRFGHIDFVIIDEAHLLSNADSSNYMKFISELKKKNPRLVVIGFTATPYRMGMGMLTDGKIFDEICFDGSDGEAFIWFIENGYLIRPVPADPGFQLDESNISIVGGDYNSAEASQAFADQDILERAVDLQIALGEEQGRQCWLNFCQSIEDAELVADMFSYKGYPVEAVHSKRSDRDEVLKALKAGGLRGVTNKDILTTGFDHPPIDMIGMLRLTRSPGLWVQMLGRGTRPVYVNGYYGSQQGHNGGPPLNGPSENTVWYDLETYRGRLDSILASPKQTCLVLDFVGNTERLGTINYPNIPKRRGSLGGDPPVRTCSIEKGGRCSPATYHHVSVKVCPECGYEWPVEQKIKDKASTKELVTSRVLDLMNPEPVAPIEIKVVGVHRMVCSHHEGRGDKKDTMRVDYFCGMNRYSAWVCFEHEARSFPRRKAEEWWRDHGGEGDAPTDVSEAVALAVDLTKPKFLKVKMNPKYPEIVDYDFRGTRFELPPEVGGPPLQDPEPDPFEEDLKRLEEERKRIQEMMMDSYDDDIPF